MKTRHNPERRAWRGRSYKRGGKRIRALRNSIVTAIKECAKEVNRLTEENRFLKEVLNTEHEKGWDRPEESEQR